MAIKQLLKREVVKQFLKFCLIGIEITVLSYLIFIILYYFLQVNYMISTGVGFVAGVLLGFLFNKLYTFQSKRKNLVTIPEYFLVYTSTLFFTLSFVGFLVEFLNIKPLLSYLLTQPFIILINFLGLKIIVFKNKKW